MLKTDTGALAGPLAQSVFSIEKHYTELPGLQSAHSVCYLLCGTTSNYSIMVVHEADGHNTKVAYPLPGLDLARARNLVLYCFENAIPINALHDVLDDLCIF